MTGPEERRELLWVDILGGELRRGRLAADGGLDRVRTIADRSAPRRGRTRRPDAAREMLAPR